VNKVGFIYKIKYMRGRQDIKNVQLCYLTGLADLLQGSNSTDSLSVC
jgi:hypothetical protein